MSQIYWDTMLFAYWIEDHPEYASKVQAVFNRMQQRGDTLQTAVFTLGEMLTGPAKRNADELGRQIRDFFRSPEVRLIPFDENTAERYATIRAAHGVSPADAIHLASAAEAGTDLFLTNDKRLRGLVIPGIQFIAGLDTELL